MRTLEEIRERWQQAMNKRIKALDELNELDGTNPERILELTIQYRDATYEKKIFDWVLENPNHLKLKDH